MTSIHENLQGVIRESFQGFIIRGHLGSNTALFGLPPSVVKNLPTNADVGPISQVRKIPWGRKWQPTQTFLPGKSHGQRGLVGYSPSGSQNVRHNLAAKQQQSTNSSDQPNSSLYQLWLSRQITSLSRRFPFIKWEWG